MTHGLTGISTDDLRLLLRQVHRGVLPCPFDKRVLMTMGLTHVADEADLLVGQDERAVRALLVEVLAERRSARGPHLGQP